MSGTAPVPVAIVFAGSQPVAPELFASGCRPTPMWSRPTPGCASRRRSACTCDHLVGDLDSADPSAVEAAVASGTTVDRHPAEKDATDLELAFDAAIARGARRVVLVDGGGDRLDHLLGNLLLLASPALAGVAGRGVLRHRARSCVARGGDPPVTIGGALGSFVTLLAESAVRRSGSSPRACATG